MNTMYTKTALKKIKKDDLVQMYLDLQAKNYDDKMEEVLEKCCNNAINETVEELQKENEKLKEEINEWEEEVSSIQSVSESLEWNLKEEIKKLKEEVDTWHKALDEKVEGLEHLQSEINLHFWRRCKGPWDRDVEKINQN